MSNSDSFIDEVTEDLRRDRLFGAMRRYGWIGILAVLLIVGGAAWNEWQASQRRSASEAAGGALLSALRQPDADARAAALLALDVRGAEAAAVGLIRASALAEAGDVPAAAAQLDAVAADAGHPRVWRDLAAFKRVILPGLDLSPADRLAALEPLSAAGAPFRTLALEQAALARIENGERDAALAILEDLMVDQEASPSLRVRSAQLMVALGASDGAGE